MIIKGVLIILIITLNIVVSIKFIEFNKWKKDFINRINKAHAERDLDTLIKMQEELRKKT